MRYRALTQADDFSRDVATFVNFIGESEYCRLLSNIGKELNVKGYVTRLVAEWRCGSSSKWKYRVARAPANCAILTARRGWGSRHGTKTGLR